MRHFAVGLLWLTVGCLASSGLLALPANAEDATSYFACRGERDGGGLSLASPENLDLYNGLLYFGGVVAIERGADLDRRWSRRNGFDTGIRNGLRLDSTSARRDADLASDITLAFSTAVLPFATIGARFHRTRDCREAWDMATDTIESLGLTLFITESVKAVAGRERPFARACDGDAPSDARCNQSGQLKSFISGHASLAAAGAGVVCSHSLRRNAWGDDPWSRGAPCALGVAAAVSTAFLRVAADRHWGSDVLLGFAVGAAVGYFDAWGPFDLLKFTTHGSDGRVSSQGFVVPTHDGRTAGMRLWLTF